MFRKPPTLPYASRSEPEQVDDGLRNFLRLAVALGLGPAYLFLTAALVRWTDSVVVILLLPLGAMVAAVAVMMWHALRKSEK